MPDHSLRGVPPEYGPAELFQGAVLALMRRDGLRVADFRDAMRCLSRMLRAGADRSEFEAPGARLLVAHDSVTILRAGASVPERRGPTLLLEGAALAERARLAVYPSPRTEAPQVSL